MSKQMQNRLPKDDLIRDLGSSIESQIAWFHHMQETQPIRYRPEHDLWEVFRYKDVQQVISDYNEFSMRGSQQKGYPDALLVSDPPRHRQLRSLVSKAFTPRRVEELTPRLTQIIDKLLEPAIVNGKLNIITEFTHQLPVRVIAEMLGLPPEDQERFHRWAYQLLRQLLCTVDAENNELIHYLSDLLDERKRDPRDDLLSALLAAEENGEHLTREDIIHMCMEMIMAGNVTTTLLLNHAISRLCRQPEIYQTLRSDPTLIPGAIEETLRYDFTPTNVWRTVRHDTVLGGHEIKAGQYVVAWKAAANFDESYFPQSEQFNVRRSPNPHLSFGHGIHYCLGAPLGRLEGRIALERIVTHFSEIRLDPESPAQYLGQLGAARIVESLGVLFTPAGSSAS
jgi:cytochrome P450